jgi:hypothetical protein
MEEQAFHELEQRYLSLHHEHNALLQENKALKGCNCVLVSVFFKFNNAMLLLLHIEHCDKLGIENQELIAKGEDAERLKSQYLLELKQVG